MEEELSQSVAEEPSGSQASAFIFDTWFGKWVVQRLTASLIWYWFVLRFLYLDLPFGLSFSRQYLLAPAAAALVLMIAFGRWARLLFYPIYVFFFPGLVLFEVSRAAYRIARLPFAAGRFASSGRALLLFSVLAFVGWLVGFSVEAPRVAAVAVLVSHICTCLLLLQLFRWASNPYRPIMEVLAFLTSKGTSFVEKTLIAPGLENEGQQRKTAITACEWILKGIDRIHPSSASDSGVVTRFARTGILPVAMAFFFTAFILLAVSFAIVHVKAQHAWGPHIAGLGSSPSFADFLYLTILSEATSVPDSVVPITGLGRILIVWNVLTGILLLTLLLALFTTSVGIHGESAIDELNRILKNERRRYSDRLDALTAQMDQQEGVVEGQFKQISSGADDA